METTKRYDNAIKGMRRCLAGFSRGEQAAELAYVRHREQAYRACNDPELRGSQANVARLTEIETVAAGWADAAASCQTIVAAARAEQSRKLREEIRELARESRWMRE